MKALDNLQQALNDAHGRRKAFKLQPIKLDDRQRDTLKYFPQHYNWQALTDIQAYQIVRGRNTQIPAQSKRMGRGNTLLHMGGIQKSPD